MRALTNAIVIGICCLGCHAQLGDAPAAHESETSSAVESSTGLVHGVVTGGIYEAGPQSFAEDGARIFCDLERLGAEWIRIEATWPGTSDETYREIVRRAHAHGIRVAVVVPASTCPAEGTYLGVGPFSDSDTASIDAFVARYVDRIDALARDVFHGDAAPDAWELTNEANLHYNPDYPAEYHAAGCIGHSRIDGNTFAWLLRRVHEWRDRAGRSELLISGGSLGAPEDPWGDGWYGAVLSSGAWVAGPVPVDYWGVHPYQPFSYDNACVNRGETGCFDAWAGSVSRGTRAVREAIAGVAGSDVPLFASEWGWAMIEPGEASCAPASMCVRTEEQLVAAMNAGAAAMTGEVEVALWYVYRDYPGSRMGLRHLWDPARGIHPGKERLWSAFASVAGGPGGDPDACWTGGDTDDEPSFDVLGFDSGDARRSTRAGDWRWGSYKAQCAVGDALTGLSSVPSTGEAHAALCRPLPGLSQDACRAVSFDDGDDRGTTHTGDWDWGHFKGECAVGEYVAGVSQTTDHRIDAILCCAGVVAHHDCRSRILQPGDDRGGPSVGDWDFGHLKADCEADRYIAGVSRTVSGGRPHAILCCE